MKYIAVGTNVDERRVVVVFDGFATVELNETAARKLVDDILRNTNHLWPVEENDDE